MDKCPDCGGELDCLAGCSGHPNNWYCEDEKDCGWTAWAGSRAKPMTDKTPREQAVSYLASHGLATEEVLLIRALCKENRRIQEDKDIALALATAQQAEKWTAQKEHDQLKAKLEREHNLIAAFMVEEIGGPILLDKGYKPALESLALELGWATDYFQNRLIIKPRLANYKEKDGE